MSSAAALTILHSSAMATTTGQEEVTQTCDVAAAVDFLAKSEKLGFFESLLTHKKWTPTNEELLRASEARLLKGPISPRDHRDQHR